MERARAFWITLLVGLLVVAACGAPSGAPGPTVAADTGPTAEEWDRVVAAAKREGKVVVIGAQGTELRDMLTVGFQRKYPEIEIEYSGGTGSNMAPKLLNELAAGQHLTDVMVTGTTTALEALRPADAIAPVLPYLVGPKVRDPTVWRGGKFSFADDDQQYSLVFSAYSKEGFLYNPDFVSPAEFTSYRDLLNPKWKGKIALRNPLIAGGSQSTFTYFYTEETLGKDFIRQLLSQDVVLSNDDRQILDWVARGQYPIALGPGNVIANEYIDRGLPLRLFDAHALREGSYVTAGTGGLVVVKDPPHPNALKVYLDYLLSREGQLAWVKEIGFPTLRSDVPHDGVAPVLVPREGVQYPELHSEYYVKLREEVVEFTRSLLPR